MPKNKKRRHSALEGEAGAKAGGSSIPIFTGDEEPSDPRTYAITQLESLPRPLHKFWWKRHHLFSLFDQAPGILLDEQSWYSVTPECIAAWTAERCASALEKKSQKGKEVEARPTRALDAFCGAGGNAIQFAMVFNQVVAMDIDPLKVALARHNARVYGVEDRITFLVGDYFKFAQDHSEWKARGRQETGADRETENGSGMTNEKLRQSAARQTFDLVYLSPPWGGITYLKPSTLAPSPTDPAGTSTSAPASKPTHAAYPLSALCAPQGGRQIIASALGITSNLAIFLPRNMDLDELYDAVKEEAAKGNTQEVTSRETRSETNAGPDELRRDSAISMELEENWAGGRLRALTLYTGEMAGEAAGEVAGET